MRRLLIVLPLMILSLVMFTGCTVAAPVTTEEDRVANRISDFMSNTATAVGDFFTGAWAGRAAEDIERNVETDETDWPDSESNRPLNLPHQEQGNTEIEESD